MIIGLAGKKGSGKTTAADALVNIDFDRQSFAHTLKVMARILMRDCGMNDEQIVNAMIMKEEIMPILGVTYRHLCQTLGTEWGRSLIHRDIWVIAARNKINTWADTVFDDVRFENEAQMIRKAGGMIIHIWRDLPNYDDHASEHGVAVLKGDIVIRNDGTIDQLIDKIYALIDLGMDK
jgi:hypothetical protein